jgi:hypothetical protein
MLQRYGFVVFITVAIGLICYRVFVEKKEDWKRAGGSLLHLFSDRKSQKALIPCFIIAAAIAFFSVWIASAFTGISPWAHAANNPGGWFAIVMGVFSVVGVYVTLLSVIDQKNTIVSFADFIDRTEKLLIETEANDYVSLMLHTPATGCLVLDRHIWHRVSHMLKSSAPPSVLTYVLTRGRNDDMVREIFGSG